MANDHFDKETSVKMNELNEVNAKAVSSQSSAQPLILGNINAANLLTSNVVAGSQRNLFIPTNLMTLPASINNNQVIGILPVFLQGSQLPGHLDSSQVIHLNNDLSISCDNGGSNNTACSMASHPTFYSSSVNQQSTLVSSDTLILSTAASKLASADTIPLLTSDAMKNNEYPIMSEQLQSKQTSTSMQTAFSLVSDLSNRSIDLDSIPTINLFKAEPSKNMKEVVQIDKNQTGINKSVCDILSKSSHGLKNIDLSIVGYQTRSKSKRKRISESEPNQLQIDEDTDTEAEEAFSSVVGAEKKENSLTRDDTIILSTTAQSIAVPQSHSSLTESDTFIISNNCSNAISKPIVATSTGIPIEMCNGSSHLNTILSVSGGNLITQPSLQSMPSIPSLMLTDSVLEGTVNPTLLSDLLSKSSENPICIQSLKPISSLDQIESNDNLNSIISLQNSTQQPSVAVSLQNSTQLPSVAVSLQNSTQQPTVSVSLQNSIQGVSLGVSLQNSGQVAPSPIALNTSVKGVQTDWVLGNMPIPVNLFPCISSVDNSTEEEPVEELPFPCVDCEQKFSSKLELAKHEKDAHKKTLKCDLCNSTFTRLGNYTRHKKIHNLKPDQKRYTCTECGRDFLQRCDLKRHLLIHSNEQPHRCKICDRGYIRHSDLVVHMRFHNKERNFKCSMCDKKYFQSGDLSRHIRRAHKPTTQLTCGHCERKYACEVTLIRHMKQVHKDIILNTVNKVVEVETN